METLRLIAMIVVTLLALNLLGIFVVMVYYGIVHKAYWPDWVGRWIYYLFHIMVVFATIVIVGGSLVGLYHIWTEVL